MTNQTNKALRFIRPDVQAMHAYAVQHSVGMVKLDAMENPFTLSPELQAQLGARLGAVEVNRYPGARIDDLKNALAQYVDLPAGLGLMLGNGSDELISLLSMACAVPNAKVLAPEPGFVMYGMSAQLQGLQYIGVPLKASRWRPCSRRTALAASVLAFFWPKIGEWFFGPHVNHPGTKPYQFMERTLYEKETEISASTGSKFSISAGWSFDDETKKLTSPEGDLTAYLLEKKAEADLDALSLNCWKQINPQFNYPVLQKVSPPAKDGWEKCIAWFKKNGVV